MKRTAIAALICGLFAFLASLMPAQAFQQTQPLLCSKSAFYDATTNGSTKIITAATVGSDRIYICGYSIVVGGTATNVQLRYGTGTNCGTGTTNITPLWQLPINGQFQETPGNWIGITPAPISNDVCIFTSAGNAVQAQIFYETMP